MAIPAETKRVQIVDRVVEVLAAISGGSTYFYTPAAVEKRMAHWKEITAGPHYSVSLDSGGRLTNWLNGWVEEEFYIGVKGVVTSDHDVVTTIARCLRDVRYALATDMASTATGSLGSLCAAMFVEDGAETDNGYLSLEGKGFFEQRIKIVIAGTIETL